MTVAATRRRPASTPAFVVVLLAVLAHLALGAAPVAAQTPPPTDPLPGSGPRMALVGQTPFVAPTDTLRIDLDVADVPDGAELTFTLRSPVTAGGQGTAQSRLDAWVGDTANQSDYFNSPKTFAVANLPPADGSGRINAEFQVVPESADEPLVGFRIADAGVYPLTVALTGPEGGAELDRFTTYLVRLPAKGETAPPLDVAAIVDLHAPVALRPDGTRSIDPTALDRIQQLTDVLAEPAVVPLTVGATPETLESLFSIGAVPATPTHPATTGVAILERFEDALEDRRVLGSTYVDVDVSAWTRSGMQAPLGYQHSHGVDVTNAVLHERAPLDVRTWVASPGLTPEALEQLRLLGIDQLVLPEAAVGPVVPARAGDQVELQDALVRPFDVEDSTGAELRAVTASDRLRARLTATDDAALNAQILVADLAVTYFGSLTPQVNDLPAGQRGVAFSVPDDARALRTLGPLLTALATTPPLDGDGVAILRPTTVSTLLAMAPATSPTNAGPATRTYTPAVAVDGPEDMGDYPEQLDRAEFDLSAFESMVVDTQPTRVLPLRQLLDVSGAVGLDADERQQYLDATTATVDAQVQGVRLPDQDPITLTAAEQPIPVVIENDLEYPVAVRLELASPKLTFPGGSAVDVSLEPGRNRIPIDVNTVSGGTFPLEIKLLTPDSRIDLGADTIEVRSTAVSWLGLVLSIGAGFFLLVWWARNWRSTRRTNRAAPPPDATEEAEDPPRSPTPSGFTVGALDDLADETSDEPSAGADPVGTS